MHGDASFLFLSLRQRLANGIFQKNLNLTRKKYGNFSRNLRTLTQLLRLRLT